MKASEIFIKAVSAFFDKKNTQAAFATKIGVDPQQLNGFLKGRRNFSEDRKELVSKCLGKTYPEMLNIGRKLVNNEEFFWALREIVKDEDRYKKLVQDTGIEDIRFKQIFNHLKQPGNPPPTPDEKNKIVAHSGFQCLEAFLAYGKKIIIENPDLEWDLYRPIMYTGSEVSINLGVSQKQNEGDIVELEHTALIKRFKNKTWAKTLNEKLIRLESLSEGFLAKAESEIDRLIELAEIMKAEQKYGYTGEDRRDPDTQKNSTPWPGSERRKTGS